MINKWTIAASHISFSFFSNHSDVASSHRHFTIIYKHLSASHALFRVFVSFFLNLPFFVISFFHSFSSRFFDPSRNVKRSVTHLSISILAVRITTIICSRQVYPTLTFSVAFKPTRRHARVHVHWKDNHVFREMNHRSIRFIHRLDTLASTYTNISAFCVCLYVYVIDWMPTNKSM